MTLLSNFKTYIDKNLTSSIETLPSYFKTDADEDDELSDNVFLKSWKKTDKVMIF